MRNFNSSELKIHNEKEK